MIDGRKKKRQEKEILEREKHQELLDARIKRPKEKIFYFVSGGKIFQPNKAFESKFTEKQDVTVMKKFHCVVCNKDEPEVSSFWSRHLQVHLHTDRIQNLKLGCGVCNIL